MLQRGFLPNDVLGHTSVFSAPILLHHQWGNSSPPATETSLLLSLLPVLSPNSVFPQGMHKSCCFTSYCHCSHRHVSALVPEPEREVHFLVPVLAVCVTSSAPQPLPAHILPAGTQPELFPPQQLVWRGDGIVQVGSWAVLGELKRCRVVEAALEQSMAQCENIPWAKGLGWVCGHWRWKCQVLGL